MTFLVDTTAGELTDTQSINRQADTVGALKMREWKIRERKRVVILSTFTLLAISDHRRRAIADARVR